MKTIVAIALDDAWEEAKVNGEYSQSTIKQTLIEVGFIHCTTPDQTISTANRHFTEYKGVVLLLIDLTKVIPEVKFEGALSGRAGVYPHIYGPLNIDAVYQVLKPLKDENDQFIAPAELQDLA